MPRTLRNTIPNGYSSCLSLSSRDTTKKKEPTYVANPEIPEKLEVLYQRFTTIIDDYKEIYYRNQVNFIPTAETHFISHQLDALELLHEYREFLIETQFINDCVILTLECVNALFTLFTFQMKYKVDLKQKLSKLVDKEDTLYGLILMKTHLESKLDSMKDLCRSQSFVFQLWMFTEDLDADSIQRSIQEILTHQPPDITLPISILNIFDSLNRTNAKNILKQVDAYLIDGRIDENIATVILSIGLYCGYYGNFADSLAIIEIASKFIRKVTKNVLKKLLLPMTVALVNMHNKKFADVSYILISVLNNLHKSDIALKPEIINIMLNLAYLLDRFSTGYEGVIWMEKLEMALYVTLPKSRRVWLKSLIMIGKSYNEKRQHNNAFTYLTKAIEYYHEKLFGEINDKNKPIYEIAAHQKFNNAASSSLLEALTPKLGYLPPAVLNCCKELMVTLALDNNRNGINIVEKYIEGCKNFYKDKNIADDLDDDETVTIKIPRIAQISSIMVNAGMKKPKFQTLQLMMTGQKEKNDDSKSSSKKKEKKKNK